MSKKFKVKSAKGEYKIITTDDEFFTNTKEYLKQYILNAIDLFEMDENTKTGIFWDLMSDIPVAVEKYSEGGGDKKDYKFSTYFGWYIGQRVNKIKGLKRKKQP